MTIFVTVPGLKKEPIVMPDTATVADFVRRAFERTGVSLFNGFGYQGQNVSGTINLNYQEPLASKANVISGQDLTTLANPNFSNAPLPVPPIATTATATTGGSVAAGTYNVRITYVNPIGETLASANTTQVTTGATSTITVTSPPAQNDATGYKVYMGTGAPTLQGGTTALGANFVQTAAVGAGAALPGSNTANAPVTPTVTPLTALGLSDGDELIIFNMPLGG